MAAGPAQAPVPPTEPWVLSPQMMQTNVPGVFAAGDAVTFPLAWRNNRKVNIPHWQMAHAQGTYDQPGGRTGKGEMGGGPKVSASPCPPLQLLALGPRSAFQGSVVACLTSLLQVMEPADRASPGAHPETSFLCPQDTPSN